jgi:hypothetical protein
VSRSGSALLAVGTVAPVLLRDAEVRWGGISCVHLRMEVMSSAKVSPHSLLWWVHALPAMSS